MKKIALIVLLAIVLYLTFIGGRMHAFQEEVQLNNAKVESINALNAMGSYVIQADVAKDIAAGNNAKAMCAVQVYASAKITQIRQCLEETICKSLIESEVKKVAPELISNEPLKIKFFDIAEKCTP
jgi:uncharacterized membrane protein